MLLEIWIRVKFGIGIIRSSMIEADAYLLWCLSTFQIHPESRYIHNQTDDSDDEKFDLQMGGDDF